MVTRKKIVGELIRKMFELENELLIIISQIHLNEREKNKMHNICSKRLNWQYIIAQAARNKVVCLLYFHLYQNKEIFKIDEWVYKILENYYIATRDVLQILDKEMFEICNLLNERKISYAILKGFNLQERLYSESERCIREFGDIDILVKKQDIREIRDVLKCKGFIQGKYNFINERIEPISRQEELYWRLNTNQVGRFIRIIPNGKVTHREICTVDVNFTIFEGGKKKDKIETEKLLSNVVLDGEKNYNVLDNEYDFLQVCYHFYKDIFYKDKINNQNDYILAKFCDVKEYVSQYRTIIKWDRLIEIIKKNDLNEAIYTTLLLVTRLYTALDLDKILKKIIPEDDYKIKKLVSIDKYIYGMIFRL